MTHTGEKYNEGKKPYLSSLGTGNCLSYQIPSAKSSLYSPHITHSISSEHHPSILNCLWQGDAPCLEGLTSGWTVFSIYPGTLSLTELIKLGLNAALKYRFLVDFS